MADWTWDSAQGVYRDARGHVVPAARIQAGLDAVIAQGQARMAVYAQRLAEGGDLLAFRVSMQNEIRQVVSAAAMAAHGGRAQMDASARGWLGSQVRTQYGYLSNLALEWAQGTVSPAQLGARAQMYAESGHQVYQAMRRRDAPSRGLTHERNVLGGARDHCAGCLAATAAGLVPLGTLVPPGGRNCVSRCRCTLAYEAVAAEAVA